MSEANGHTDTYCERQENPVSSVLSAHHCADILTQSGDPFLFIDCNGNIAFWNRGAELLLGWQKEEILGRPLDIIIADKNPFPLTPPQDNLHESILVQNHNTTLRARDNTVVPVKITVTLVWNSDQTFLGSTVSVRDITREMEIERELRWRIGELSLIEDIMHSVQEGEDLDRSLTFMLTMVTAGSGLGFNRAFLFLAKEQELTCHLAIGASTWEEAGKLWPEVQGLPNLQAVLDHVLQQEQQEESIASGMAKNWRIPLTDTSNILIQCLNDGITRIWPRDADPDGATSAILGSPAFTAVPLKGGGEPIGVLVADNAVTSRPIDIHAIRLLELLASQVSYAILYTRLHERLVHHALNLEAANEQITRQQKFMVRSQRKAALGEIAAAISHEFKTPLVSIGGFTRSLQRDLGDNPTYGPMLEIIISQIDRIERVVEGVSALADLPIPIARPLDIQSVVDDTYTVVRAEAEGRRVELVSDIPPDLPEPFLDDEQIHQLVLNLVTNAVAASSGGDVVVTRVRQSEDTWYTLSVQDTGTGVPKEAIPTVFGPLFTSKPTRKGLGLSIVSQVVQHHHGRIEVTSDTGKGTTISVHLPPRNVLEPLLNLDRAAAEQNGDFETLDPLTIATLRAR